MSDRLQRDTTLTAIAPDRYAAGIDPGWWIVAGPNGGYIAALLLRAMTETVADADRPPRSLTIHYTAPAAEGACEIATKIERSGFRLMTVTARLEQEGRLIALAVGAFSKPRPSIEFQHLTMPEVAAPENLAPIDRGSAPHIAIHDRWESLPCIGDPLHSGSQSAVTGGWIRPTSPRTIDPLLAAALTDAWAPAIFTRLRADDPAMMVPTVDLSIHFRAPLPYEGARPDDFYLVHFRSNTARDGFIEEDGELWSRSGILLAQSRQLAVMR